MSDGSAVPKLVPVETLLTMKDLCRLLGCGEKVVRYEVLPELPAFKIGREWRVLSGDLERWVAAKRDSTYVRSRL